MKRTPVSLEMLRSMLVNAECRAVCEPDFIDRATARDEVKRLKPRIARREREESRATAAQHD